MSPVAPASSRWRVRRNQGPHHLSTPGAANRASRSYFGSVSTAEPNDLPPDQLSAAAPTPGVAPRLKTDIVVIGAGQAGLSSAYHLKRRGLAPNRGFVVLDQSPNAGGAWQFRWPSLTLSTVNRIHDLPGMPFSETVEGEATNVEAAVAVPRYFAAYEKAFSLPVYRPVKVTVVCDRGAWLNVETDRI